jgi:monovalent cation/hydrogen antiporter
MHELLISHARRLAFQGSIKRRACTHPADMTAFAPDALTCPGCEAKDGEWAKLRMCLSCGSVGCCDSSALQHARAHFDATGHPVMRSIEPGEAWTWCYVDQAYTS